MGRCVVFNNEVVLCHRYVGVREDEGYTEEPRGEGCNQRIVWAVR